jgi:hypothetical protein
MIAGRINQVTTRSSVTFPSANPEHDGRERERCISMRVWCGRAVHMRSSFRENPSSPRRQTREHRIDSSALFVAFKTWANDKRSKSTETSTFSVFARAKYVRGLLNRGSPALPNRWDASSTEIETRSKRKKPCFFAERKFRKTSR